MSYHDRQSGIHSVWLVSSELLMTGTAYGAIHSLAMNVLYH